MTHIWMSAYNKSKLSSYSSNYNSLIPRYYNWFVNTLRWQYKTYTFLFLFVCQTINFEDFTGQTHDKFKILTKSFFYQLCLSKTKSTYKSVQNSESKRKAMATNKQPTLYGNWSCLPKALRRSVNDLALTRGISAGNVVFGSKHSDIYADTNIFHNMESDISIIFLELWNGKTLTPRLFCPDSTDQETCIV